MTAASTTIAATPAQPDPRAAHRAFGWRRHRGSRDRLLATPAGIDARCAHVDAETFTLGDFDQAGSAMWMLDAAHDFDAEALALRHPDAREREAAVLRIVAGLVIDLAPPHGPAAAPHGCGQPHAGKAHRGIPTAERGRRP